MTSRKVDDDQNQTEGEDMTNVKIIIIIITLKSSRRGIIIVSPCVLTNAYYEDI